MSVAQLEVTVDTKALEPLLTALREATAVVAARGIAVNAAVQKCALRECEQQEYLRMAEQSFAIARGERNSRLLMYRCPVSHEGTTAPKFQHAAALFVHLMQCPSYRAEIEPQPDDFVRPMGVTPPGNDAYTAYDDAGNMILSVSRADRDLLGGPFEAKRPARPPNIVRREGEQPIEREVPLPKVRE